MARPLRIEFPGAIYHVMSRGNARQTVFRDDSDYQRLSKGLETVVGRLEVEVTLYINLVTRAAYDEMTASKPTGT